mmetsp:Transcript_20673/g.29621  ORF Transcript_20673/g.29621 Transcript_20673/m.29621 type:complete len:160 (-) Transcript_20673:624-1103(-)
MKTQFFGSFLLNPSQIFFESALSLAIVNLKPIVPGHVLILPKRVVPRLSQLTNDEYSDLFHSVRIVSNALEPYYSADAFNIAVQDGKEAGQSVYHVHVHILPRKAGDFQRNDDIYEELDNQKLNEAYDIKNPFIEDRKPRSESQMAAEAAILKSLFTNS